MSNRTLIEINHDRGDVIKNNPDNFISCLLYHLGTGDELSAKDLEYFGVRVIGMKHHSEGHDITWGSAQEKEVK